MTSNMNFNKMRTSLLAFLLFSICSLSAQDEQNNFWNNVRFGGGIGLNFANDFFSLTLAPSAIYEFDQTFSAGVGLNATYNSQKNVYKSTILGGSLIGLANVATVVQLSTELEQLNINRKFDNSLNDNFWNTALFLGAGYRNNNFTVGIRYNVLHDDDPSIYADAWVPFVRVYF